MVRSIVWLSLIWILLSCASKPKATVEQKEQEHFQVFKLEMSHQRQLFEPEAILPAVSVVAVGDIMLGNHASQYIKKFGYSYPFAATDSILRSGDLTIGNLEGPLARGGVPFQKRFTFRVPPQSAKSLRLAGFDVMTLANNHILDYGDEALTETVTALDSLEILYCGVGQNRESACKPAIVERNGLRIAVFGYSMTFPSEFWASDTSGGTCFPYEGVLKRTIPHYDSTCDIVITNFHWGRELKNTPRDYQIAMAHKVIDLGADLVIGHHPHVLQGMEIYKNRLIAYSLGNFSFASYSRRATESVILKVMLMSDGFLFARVIPINVNNYEVAFQPRPAPEERAIEVIAHLNDYSQQLENPALFDSTGFLWGDFWIIYDSSEIIAPSH